jgi:hypothetical protein
MPELLEYAAPAAGLVVLLAPLAGAATRLISFSVDPAVPDGWYLASAAPVSELAATGAQLIPLALAAAAFTGTIMFAMRARNRRLVARSERSQHPSRNSWVFATVFVAWSFLSQDFPAPSLVYLASFVAAATFVAMARATRWIRVLVPVLILYVGVTLAGGLSQSPSAGDYRFAAEVGVPPGIYTRMGSVDGFVFLRTCESTPRILSIREDSILSAVLVRNEHWYRAPILYWMLGWPELTGLREAMGLPFLVNEQLSIGPRYQCSIP